MTDPAQLVASGSFVGYDCLGDSALISISASGGTIPYEGTGIRRFAVGTITCILTDANGCVATSSLSIPQGPGITSSTTPPSCFGGSNGSIVLTTQPDTTIPSNPGVLLSEIFTNPSGDDSPYEWVELIATDNIDFAQKPYTVIMANNGKASTKGWMQGGAPTPTNNSTYAFQIDSGKVVPGEVFYVGGSLMAPTGRKLRVRNTATQPGDGGLGSPNLNTGVLGNGGGIADGVAVFDKPVSQLDSNSVPRDALFFGTYIGDAALSDTSKGFTLPSNDRYTGGHLDTNDFKVPDPLTGYLVASGGYNAGTGAYTQRTWSVASGFSNAASSVSVTPRFTYQWSNGSTSTSINGLTAGNYSVIITSAGGCVDTLLFTVTQPQDLVTNIQLLQGIQCFNDSARISVTAAGGTPPYSGTFNSLRLTPGNYSYTVIDSNGCRDSSSISITGPSSPLRIQASAGTVLCNGGTTTVAVSATGGTSPYSGNGSFQTSAGNKTYSVTDARGCLVDTSFTITQPAPLTVSANAGSISCFGGSATVNVTATGGTAPYSGTGTFSRVAGTYAFQVTDNNGCSASSSQVAIQQPTLLSSSVSASGIQCYGTTNGSIDLSPAGGTAPYAYQWSNSSTAQDLSSLSAGTYSVQISDANGCTATNTATINQYPQIVITGFTPVAANQGEPFRLSGSGLTGIVSLRFNTVPAGTIAVLGDTAVTTVVPSTAVDGPITVINQNGCSATSTQSFDYLDYYGNINLKVFIEGYNDNGLMVPALVNRGLSPNFFEVDTVRLLLADSANPSIIIDSAKAVLDIFGTASFQFRGALVGKSYYLVFRTPNTIETWSAEPILINIQTTYDFTDAASKAYGSNMVEVEPGIWAMFSGELNYDGYIDAFDATVWEIDNIAFSFGYFPADLNGDGYVDTFDSPFLERNNLNFVFSLRP